MNTKVSDSPPRQAMTIQLVVRSDPRVIALLENVLDSKRVKNQIQMEVESVLLFEVANELETETPENIDVEWVEE